MKFKNIFLLGLVLALPSCGVENFKYDKNKACIVNLGANAFSVVFDRENIFIERNRNIVFNSQFTIRTDNKIFKTTEKYFYGEDAKNILNELKNSDKIFVEYQEKSGEKGSSKFRTLIYGENFSKQIEVCNLKTK